jgi:hypothetical protein
MVVVTGENHQADARRKLYHIMLCRVHLTWAGFELTALVVMGINYIGSCCCEFESRSRRGVKHYLINFVSDFKHHQTIKQTDWNGDKCFHLYTGRVLVFNATFNNIRLVYLYIYFIIIRGPSEITLHINFMSLQCPTIWYHYISICSALFCLIDNWHICIMLCSSLFNWQLIHLYYVVL